MSNPHIIFLTGASGAGKTTLVDALSHQLSDVKDVACLHFDSIGVPSEATMIKEFGSGKNWQKSMTYQWIQRIAQDYRDRSVVIIEGQTEPTFIKDALNLYGVHTFTILLVHASHSVRHERLRLHRHQPELVNPEMDNWSQYLYTQACEMNIEIIDTSMESLHHATERILKLVNRSVTDKANQAQL